MPSQAPFKVQRTKNILTYSTGIACTAAICLFVTKTHRKGPYWLHFIFQIRRPIRRGSDPINWLLHFTNSSFVRIIADFSPHPWSVSMTYIDAQAVWLWLLNRYVKCNNKKTIPFVNWRRWIMHKRFVSFWISPKWITVRFAWMGKFFHTKKQINFDGLLLFHLVLVICSTDEIAAFKLPFDAAILSKSIKNYSFNEQYIFRMLFYLTGTRNLTFFQVCAQTFQDRKMTKRKSKIGRVVATSLVKAVWKLWLQ